MARVDGRGLPDPAVKPLVHPLEVPDARRPFRTSWLIETLTNPAVGLCVAAMIWFGSRSYVVPLVAGFAIVGFGALAARGYREQAWGLIPRARQDRERPLPVAWDLMSALVLAVVLLVALLLIAVRLGQTDISAGVREFTFGMAVAVGLLVGVDFIRTALRSPRSEQRRRVVAVPVVASAVTAAGVAYFVLFDSSGPSSPATVILGGVAMVAVGLGVAVWQHVQYRRPGI